MNLGWCIFLSHFCSECLPVVSVHGSFVSRCRFMCVCALVVNFTSQLVIYTTLKIHHITIFLPSHSYAPCLFSILLSQVIADFSFQFIRRSPTTEWEEIILDWSAGRARGNGWRGRSYLRDRSVPKTPGLKNWIWQVLGLLRSLTAHYLQGSNSLSCVFMMHDLDWKFLWNLLLRKHTFAFFNGKSGGKRSVGVTLSLPNSVFFNIFLKSLSTLVITILSNVF